MKNITHHLFLSTVLLVSLGLSAPSHALFGIEDKLINKFAGCYKKAQNNYNKCLKTAEKSIKKSKSRLKDFKSLETAAKKLDDAEGELKSCIQSSVDQMVKCRLDKKKFKPGKTEDQMDKDIRTLEDKLDELAFSVTRSCRDGNYCEDKCAKEFGVKHYSEVAEEDVDDVLTCIGQCELDYCENGTKLRKEIEKKREAGMKDILEEYISTEASGE